jgi:serine/threonine protein kinase/Tfp pilus assembly protein PilF
MTIKCPACKSENLDDSKFCRECGAPLKASRDVSGTKTFQTPLKGISKETIIAGKYKIINKIGEGGMGVVYKAKDTRLDRSVALKFLPPELTRDPESKQRFLQEARAAAALDHPNICTVYEVDEIDGQTFIAMSYIPGRNLKDKLKEGPLNIDEAKDIALQVAEGLKEAHEKGIIHRDIKPANIMLTEKGQAKITDFGLAKLSWGVDLTKTFTVMGTAAYMSPEQAKGEAVDHRTDIWSFGAMLYEMFSGRRPFRSSDERAVFYSILNEKPDPMRDIRPEIPEFIEQIILKAMEKDPSYRYQQMDELLKHLKDNRSVSAPPEEKRSIIVLPFENISPDPDQEYFSDGLTEEIITDLSHIHDLLVISRSSAMTFKESKKKIKDIAGEVNVRYALEGSVRKAGNNLRITAQLIDAQTDHHLWAEKFSGTLGDVFDIQETVSRSIAEALKLKLSPEENRKISERLIENVPAYELYLKANAEMFKFTEQAINRAIGYLQNALSIIGDNALLYSGLAFAYFNFVNIGVKQEEYLVTAEEYVKKALAMDPEFPKAHVVLGWIYCLGELPKSIYHLKKALEITPYDSMALGALAMDYLGVGKVSAAARISEKLLEIDPLDYPPNYARGAIHFYDGQYGKALEAWGKLYTMYPESAYSKWSYALALIYNNKYEEAFSIIDESAKSDPGNVLTKLGLLLKYGVLGNKKEAFQEMTPDFRKTCRRTYTFAHHVACVFALLDEKEEALNWLESAVNRGFINYPLLAERDPLLENIREEARFNRLMERVKHEWENVEEDSSCI